MHMEAGVLREPRAYLFMRVRAVVVEDAMDVKECSRPLVNRFQKVQELLMPVARHTGADHLTLQDIERGEERGRAVSFVIVSRRPAFPGCERKRLLRAVERLDLAL